MKIFEGLSKFIPLSNEQYKDILANLHPFKITKSLHVDPFSDDVYLRILPEKGYKLLVLAGHELVEVDKIICATREIEPVEETGK